MRSLHRFLFLSMSFLVAACGAVGGQGASAPPTAVRNAAEAAAAVTARSPLFDGIAVRDPALIGQGEWWTATPDGSGDPPASWTVVFEIGWGDCEAGCIDRHTWTYRVAADGAVTFGGETGSPLADDVLAARMAAATVTGVGGRVLAGPVCPVERPGDATCAPRPVAGAVLAVMDSTGAVLARLTTDGSGLYRFALPAGAYTLAAAPVEGLMGTPAALPFEVRAGVQTALDMEYDTGIR